MKIKIESGHFWLDFDNGYTLSVFNGFGSYTENHYASNNIEDVFNKKFWESETVEIGILKDDLLVTNEILKCGDTVKTVDLKELIEIINLLLNYEK